MYLFNDNNQMRNGNTCTCRRKRGMKHCVKEMKEIKGEREKEDEDIIVYRREITQQYLVNDEEVVVSHFAAVVAEDIAVSE